MPKRYSNKMEDIKKLIENLENQMKQMIENQHKIENKMNKIQEKLENIEKDIYIDEESDSDIICPYCNYEFEIEYDEEEKETECPSCHNIIELDWSGNLENDDFNECFGDCRSCGGCGTINDTDDDNEEE